MRRLGLLSSLSLLDDILTMTRVDEDDWLKESTKG